MKKTALIGIDFGSRRIGLARADKQARLAEPLMTIQNDGTVLGRLAKAIAAEQADTVIIGIPRNLAGEETLQSRQVRLFAAEVEKRLQCRVVLQDETLSTISANELKWRFPEADKDSLAATIILEDYLRTL